MSSLKCMAAVSSLWQPNLMHMDSEVNPIIVYGAYSQVSGDRIAAYSSIWTD